MARGGEAARVLEVEREEVCGRSEAGHEEERRRSAGGQGPVAEFRRIEQGLRGSALNDEQGDESEEAGTEAAERRCRRPSVLGGEGESHDDEDRRGGREDRPGNVESPQARVAGIGRHRAHSEDDDDEDERNVDREHRPPPPGVGEHPAEDGSEDHSGRPGGSPDAQGAVAVRPLTEADGEQCEGRGSQCRTPESLDAASCDEHPFGDGECPQQGAEREECQPREEHPPAAEGIGEPAAEQEEPAEGDGIGADDPLERRRGESQRRDLGQGDEDDVVIEADEQLGETESGEQARPRACGGVRRGHWQPPYNPSSDNTKSKHIVRVLTI